MGSSVGLAEGDLDGAVVGAAVVLGAGVGARTWIQRRRATWTERRIECGFQRWIGGRRP